MLSKNTTKNERNLKDRLLQFGLSEDQSAVYLAGISLGPTTILKLSKNSGIPRTTIYTIINQLVKLGLFKINIIGFKKTYEAENPKRLVLTLEQKAESLKESIPDFLSLYNLKESGSNIRYYEGLHAIQPLYLESLYDIKNNDTLLVISNSKEWMTIDEKYFQSYREKRARLGIQTKILVQESDIVDRMKEFQRNFNEEIRTLPKTTSINVDFFCTPKRVVIFQTKPPYVAIEIENDFIIVLYKNLFETIWNTIQ